jgi:multiple sugar transport system ATP-binding protein
MNHERIAPYVGARVMMGLRPEDFHETPPPGVADTRLARIAGVVDLAEPMGPEKHLNFTAGGTGMIARVSPRCPAEDGDRVELVVDLSQAHLFDPRTERSILHGDAV